MTGRARLASHCLASFLALRFAAVIYHPKKPRRQAVAIFRYGSSKGHIIPWAIMPREQCALFSGTATLRYMRKALFERIKADNERSSKPGAGAALAQAIGTRPAASRAPTPPAGPVSPLGKEGTRPRAGRGSADDSGVQGQGPAPSTAKRPAVLRGVENLGSLIRVANNELAKTPISDRTRTQYEGHGARLHSARDEGQAIDLTPYERNAATYYAYRAAVRWHAVQRGMEALRRYDAARKRGDEAAKAQAWQQVIYASADMLTYPKDAKPGLPSAKAVALGLDDPKQQGAPTKAKASGLKPSKRSTSKLKAANTIARKCPDWRAKVWARLVEVESQWLDCTAVAALTGARPQEVGQAEIRRKGNALEVLIYGAKVSGVKGQEWRLYTLQNDGSPEFAHLFKISTPKEARLRVPPGKKTAANFSAALSRAGKQALPGTAIMSGYVYRHSLAADLKADGASRVEIAQALGHAVTKTQDAYGRAIGGKAGARKMQIQTARGVKVNHTDPSVLLSYGKQNTPAPVQQAAATITTDGAERGM